MTKIETKLKDCLIRTARRIGEYTYKPTPPAWVAVLVDIFDTLRETGVAVRENQPYPPGSDTPLDRALSDAESLRQVGQAAMARAASTKPLNMVVTEVQTEPPAAEPVALPDENTVIVGVHGGCVQWVQKGGPNLRVIVRDYDVDGSDDARLKTDGAGDKFAEWEE